MRPIPFALALVAALILSMGLLWNLSTPTYNHPLGLVSQGEPRTLADLREGAEAVVAVRVLSATPRYDARDRLVYTVHELEVSQALEGALQAGERFTLRIRGGEAEGQKTAPWPDHRPLEPGSHHLLFLRSFRSESRPELDGWYLVSGGRSMAEIQADSTLRLPAIQTEGAVPVPEVHGEPHPLQDWAGSSLADLVRAIR